MENKNMDNFVLSRDSVPVFTGTDIECMKYVHKKHSFSFTWALEFEGYSMEKKNSDE